MYIFNNNLYEYTYHYCHQTNYIARLSNAFIIHKNYICCFNYFPEEIMLYCLQ